MKRNLGHLLLAIYLILVGLTAPGLIGIGLGQFSIAMPILALAAGVLLLLGK